MTITQKLKKAGLWQSFLVVVQILTQFIYIAVLARLLDKSDFGLMAIVSSLIGLTSIFSDGGLGPALIQRKDITKFHIIASLQFSMLVGIAFCLISILLARNLSEFYNDSRLVNLIYAISINIFISGISGISLSLLHRNFKFKEASLISIISIICGYLIGIILAYNGFGVWSMIFTSLITSIGEVIGFLYFAPIYFSFKCKYDAWRDLFNFGFGITLLKACNYLSEKGIILLLAKILTFNALGVFERTYKIKTLPSLYLGNVLDKIMFPTMSAIQDDEDKLFSIYQMSLGIVNSLLMPLAIFLIYYTDLIVLILFGKNWGEAILPLQIMFFVLPFSSSGRMADSVVRAKGLIYKNLIRKILYVIFLLFSTTVGGYFFGVVGAAVGVTISFLFNYILMLLLVRKIFARSIGQIFFQPIFSGIKLSILLAVFINICNFMLLELEVEKFTSFFIVCAILSVSIGMIKVKCPKIFGIYINKILLKSS